MAIDLVIFDMDGVLVDSELISCRAGAACLTEAGFPIDERTVCERYLGTSVTTMFKDVEARFGRKLPEGFRDHIRQRTLEAYEGELEPVTGIERVLARTRGPVCVASSSHPERIRRSLELCGLHERLQPNLFSSTMVENGKPAPDLFLYAARTMGAEPGRCMVVEDSIAGVTAGVAAGMTVVGFTAGSHVDHAVHAPKLRAAGAHHVATDADGLIRLMEDLNA
ncbi:MAG: HAD family hydrolase [Geminicoccaceae bacterium]|nr:HAD family hydrolase [Geminicoccaceae bacterium]